MWWNLNNIIVVVLEFKQIDIIVVVVELNNIIVVVVVVAVVEFKQYKSDDS